MKKLNVKNSFTKSNQNGITLIALIVTIIVLIIIAGISIATLTADNGVLRQTNLAKVTQIEGTAREQVRLACAAMRVAIAEAHAKDNSYSAKDNISSITNKLLDVIKKDTVQLEPLSWSAEVTDSDNGTLKIEYAGGDYKQACNDNDAEITFEITLGQKSIEITDESNSTLKDENQNDVEIDIGGDDNTDGGNDSSGGSGGNGSSERIAVGLYETGTKTMIMSWDELVSSGILSSSGKIVSGQEANLAGDLVISDTLTSVPSGAYKNCTELTGVTIPDGVTSIGSYAFSGCTSLTSIEIPDSVTTIDSPAFYECTSLETITFGENSQLTTIGVSAFCGCTSLTSIEIPEGITTIGSASFENCTSLETITFGENSQLTTIGSSAFSGCKNLTSIDIPKGVTSISYRAFWNCYGLTSITIPDSVTTIDDYAFYGCTSLTDVTIPATVTTIGSCAFYECTNLETITFGENSQLTTIGDFAFNKCTSLTSINIPDSVTSIGSAAFQSCTNMKDVYYEGELDDWLTISFAGHNSNPCGAGKANLYFNDVLVTNIEIPDSVTSISKCFYGCTSLTSVTFGANSQLTTIGEYAFRGCTNLTSITIPNKVKSIGYKAFEYCTSLESINIPEGVTSIGNAAFANCSNLKNITISTTTPPSITDIINSSNGTFHQSRELTTITVPKGTLSAYQTAWSSVASKLVEASS